jgi:uncharacterized protein (DUF305 family)
MSKSLQVSLGIIIFLFGAGFGYYLTPEYSMQAEQMKSSHDLGPVDRWLDLRYVDNMIAHHLAAIFLLEQAQQYSTRTEIKDLAAVVIAADKAGIEQLYEYKAAWYQDKKQITRFNQVNLGSADEKFDLRLLNALIDHHQEAIDAAREVSTKSTRNEVLNLADEVKRGLSENLVQLEAWRKAWYGI